MNSQKIVFHRKSADLFTIFLKFAYIFYQYIINYVYQ
jgi:hypothetical protein